jgi:hypothetical protein
VPGRYVITYNANDGAGNAAITKTRTVLIQDSEPPTIDLEGDTEIEIDFGAEFSEPGFTAADACDGDLTSSVVTSGAVDTTAAGTYILRYNVADAAGRAAAERIRIVTVGELDEVALQDTAQSIIDTVAANGAITLLEAQELIPGLTEGVFSTLDTDSDGMLTQLELEATGAVAPPSGGCNSGEKSLKALSDIKNFFGDLFLLGLLALVLVAWRGVAPRP